MNGQEWLTVAELGARLGVGKDRAGWLLVAIGVRSATDDGATRYRVSEVEQKLDERDAQIMQSAAATLDYIEDAELAAEVLHTAFTEMRLAWLQGRADGDVLDILKRRLTLYLPKITAAQRAQAGTGGPTVPEILRDFERTIVAALRERRGQRPAPDPAKQGARS